MGIGAWWHWLVVLLIVVLVFGTKKLRNLGGDVGGAVKNFKDAMTEGQAGPEATPNEKSVASHVAEVNLIESEMVDVPVKKAAPKRKVTAAKKTTATKLATAKPRATATKKSSEN